MENRKYLKIEIIKIFIQSILFAGIFVVLLFWIGFSVFSIVAPEQFTVFMQWYNNSYKAMIAFLLMAVGLFSLITFLLLVKKMTPITDAISEISFNIEKVAGGNLDIEIETKRKDELGKLAENVNHMANLSFRKL